MKPDHRYPKQTRKFFLVSAFSLIELLVGIAIIAILMAILFPMLERVRHRGYITACASNLRTIGQALTIYGNEQHGEFPRTLASQSAPLTIGTGAAAADPFQLGGPVANDVTAGIFLLMRVQKLPASIFICPYNDVRVYEAEPADPQTHSNFTDEKKSLGYSFANPFPNVAAVQSGYRLGSRVASGFAVAADKNPGTIGDGDNVIAPSADSPQPLKVEANSNNHEKDGQNILFGDGHVSFETTVFVGIARDNIYTNKLNVIMASPIDATDSVLLPTDD